MAADLPAHRLPPRGHHRAPAGRHPHRHGIGGKVNPPLRPREDVEALWEHLLDGKIDWVVSDHACCRDELKFGEPARRRLPGQVRLRRRRVPAARPDHRGPQARAVLRPDRRADLAQPGRSGSACARKGAIAVGLDADICLVDPTAPGRSAPRTPSPTQEYTPFEGFELTAKVTDTFLRGTQILTDGKVTGTPGAGQYVRRPSA